VRVGAVERLDDLVVVAAGLAVAQELHALDLDLLRVGPNLDQTDHLGDELVERHGVFVVLLPGRCG
jgi:hypothetical protein